MKRKMEISELIFKIIAYVFLIVFAVLCVYPFLYAIGASLSSEGALTNGNSIVLIPMIGSGDDITYGATLKAYEWAFTNVEFWVAYSNTLFMTFFGTIWCLFYSILGAYALSKKRIMGRRGWNFFLVFTMWFTAGVIATYSNYAATGRIFATIAGYDASSWQSSIDGKWLVVIAMGMNATNIVLLRNAFEGVPSEIEEAARIDGATELQVLTKVYIPMSKATIATVALFFGISRWNGYFWSMKVLGTSEASGQPYSWPVQVYLRNFLETYTTIIKPDIAEYDANEWARYESQGYGATACAYAIVVCSVIPILIIYPFIQKYFAKGVNMGGVKE